MSACILIYLVVGSLVGAFMSSAYYNDRFSGYPNLRTSPVEWCVNIATAAVFWPGWIALFLYERRGP